MKTLLIIDTVAIAVCIVIIVMLGARLYRELKTSREKTECSYKLATKIEQVTTKSGLTIDTSLTGWFCSHCGNHEENIYANMQYCPHCGRRIGKFCR